jgi:hypothetical protein
MREEGARLRYGSLVVGGLRASVPGSDRDGTAGWSIPAIEAPHRTDSIVRFAP